MAFGFERGRLTVSLSKADLDAFAESLEISRATFEEAFNAEVPFDSDAEFKTIAANLDAQKTLKGRKRDVRDFKAALLIAAREGWLLKLLVRQLATLTAVKPTSPEPGRVVLQSLTSVAQGFPTGLDVTTGSLAAMRRSCMVRAQKKSDSGWKVSKGSGFLIGPHLILTNYHVIAPLLQPDQTPLSSGIRLGVAFDFHEVERDHVPQMTYQADFKSDHSWLVAHSLYVPPDAETAPLLGMNLDYAVIRLNGRPGDQRGYYGFDELPELPDLGATLHVWQFPMGNALRATTSIRVAAPPDLAGPPGQVPPRIYHEANTLVGSSGSLILDGDYQPVGLHDAGFNPKLPAAEQKNRGVPLRLVLEKALGHIQDEISDIPKKTGWHPITHQPIIGREGLQDNIFRAMRGEARILIVRTVPGADFGRIPRLGRSYTRRILESCLPPNEHRIIMLDASLITADAFLTAARLVEAVDPNGVGTLPMPRDETTLDAEISPLVSSTFDVLLRSAGNQTLWLMIDDIDKHEIGTEWIASEFLVALYRRIAREPRLRVVLTGLPRPLDGLSDLREKNEILSETLEQAPEQQDLSAWIQSHLIHDLPPDEFGPRISKVLASIGEWQVHHHRGTVPDLGGTDQHYAPIEAWNTVITRHAKAAFDREAGNE